MNRITYFFFLYLISNIATAQIPPIHVGNEKQLFIDHKFIAQSHHVTLTVNPPIEMGPAVRSDSPWERGGLGYNNVIDYNGQFRMWYMSWVPVGKSQYGKRCMCYAVSTDGINWEKPKLGIIEFNGSKENNILPTELHDSGTVFHDPKAPPDSRFKMIAVRNFGKDDAGVYMYTSPDGIHFALHPTLLLDLWPDTQNQVFYDTRIKKYVAYLRSWKKRSDAPYGSVDILPLRTVSRVEINNLLQPWPYNKMSNPYYLWGDKNIPAITQELEVVMSCDKEDPPETDLYTPCVVQYPWADDVYFAFPSPYRHFPPPPEGRPNDGLLDIQLSTSRDGINWTRYRTPYVDLNLEMKCLYMGIGMLRIGDDIYQYYLGTKNTHGDDRGKEIQPDRANIYCVKQRLDGFMSADAAYTGGFLITPSIVFQGSSLELNINTSATGHALVEILDESGKPLEGYTLHDADPIQGNFIHKTVSWNGNEYVGSLEGKSIRLHIVMRAAKLHGFKFGNK